MEKKFNEPNLLIKKTLILIPAFNEADNIKKVINECLNYFDNILVVDDGSTDNTFKEISQINKIVVLRHLINSGQGQALNTGINFFLNDNEYQYLITIDADGQHSVLDALEMLNYAYKNNYDAVLGSRFLKVESERLVPLSKKIILKLAKIFERIFYNISLSDAHNGLRVLNKKSCKIISDLDSSGMAHATEISYKLIKKKLSIVEYPCKIKYKKNRIKGQSILNSLNILSELLQKK